MLIKEAILEIPIGTRGITRRRSLFVLTTTCLVTQLKRVYFVLDLMFKTRKMLELQTFLQITNVMDDY